MKVSKRKKCLVCGNEVNANVQDAKCVRCSENALHESWLEKKIKKLFGRKCKEYEPYCPTCDAWFLYETILEDNRGKL